MSEENVVELQVVENITGIVDLLEEVESLDPQVVHADLGHLLLVVDEVVGQVVSEAVHDNKLV